MPIADADGLFLVQGSSVKRKAGEITLPTLTVGHTEQQEPKDFG